MECAVSMFKYQCNTKINMSHALPVFLLLLLFFLRGMTLVGCLYKISDLPYRGMMASQHVTFRSKGISMIVLNLSTSTESSYGPCWKQ